MSNTAALSRNKIAQVFDQVLQRKKVENNTEEVKNLEQHSQFVNKYFRQTTDADTMTISESRIAKLTQDKQEDATYMGPRDRFINNFRSVDKKQELELLFAIIQADSNYIVKSDENIKSVPQQAKRFYAFMRLYEVASSKTNKANINTQVEEQSGLVTSIKFTIDSWWQNLWHVSSVKPQEVKINDKLSSRIFSPLVGGFLDRSTGGKLFRGTSSEVVELSIQACQANANYLNARKTNNSLLTSQLFANDASLDLEVDLNEQITAKINTQRNEYASYIFKSLNKNVEFKDLFANSSKRTIDGFVEINTTLQVKVSDANSTEQAEPRIYTIKYTEVFHAESGAFVSNTQPKIRLEELEEAKKQKYESDQSDNSRLELSKPSVKLNTKSTLSSASAAQNSCEAKFIYSNLLSLNHEGKVFFKRWKEIVTTHAKQDSTEFKAFVKSIYKDDRISSIIANFPNPDTERTNTTTDHYILENLYLLFYLKQNQELYRFLRSVQLNDSNLVSQLVKYANNNGERSLINNLHEQICFLEKYDCLIKLNSNVEVSQQNFIAEDYIQLPLCLNRPKQLSAVKLWFNTSSQVNIDKDIFDYVYQNRKNFLVFLSHCKEENIDKLTPLIMFLFEGQGKLKDKFSSMEDYFNNDEPWGARFTRKPKREENFEFALKICKSFLVYSEYDVIQRAMQDGHSEKIASFVHEVLDKNTVASDSLIAKYHKNLVIFENETRALDSLLEKRKKYQENIERYLEDFIILRDARIPDGIVTLDFEKIAKKGYDIHSEGQVPKDYGTAAQPVKLERSSTDTLDDPLLVDARMIKGGETRELDKNYRLVPRLQNYVMSHFQDEYTDVETKQSVAGIWSKGQHCLAHEIMNQCWAPENALKVEPKNLQKKGISIDPLFMYLNKIENASDLINDQTDVHRVPVYQISRQRAYLELLEKKYLRNGFIYYDPTTKGNEELDEDSIKQVFDEFKDGLLDV